MKAIEQASLALLVASVLLLSMVAAVFAFSGYTIPPPSAQAKDSSYATTVREATSLEGLRKVCAFWAQREDASRAFVNAVHDQYRVLLRDVLTTMTLMGVLFGAGLLYIYLTARRLQRG